MEQVIIRDAKREDIHELAIVRQEVWNTTYRGIYADEVIDNFNYEKAEQSFSDKIGKEKTIFKVAIFDNKIIGYICFGISDKPFEDYDYVINYLHILKTHQGMGLGKLFFNVVFDYAKELKIDKFYVSCNKYNYKAHGFYEKMGGIKAHVDGNLGNKQKEQIYYVYNIGDITND